MNIFIIKIINNPKILLLFKVKKTLIKYIKSGLLILNNNLVYFLNNYLEVN